MPVILFITPRFNRNPAALVLGAFFAVIGVIFNRWNVTVSGLFVPLSYSPGTLYQLPPGNYFPSLIEWSIGVGIVGYMLMMITLGMRYLPLFDESTKPSLSKKAG